MESVNHIAIVDRVNGAQIHHAGIIRSGGDDGAQRRGFSNGRDQLCLDFVPAAGVVYVRFVHDLKENMFGIARGVVRGQTLPEIRHSIHGFVTVSQLLFVIFLGEQVELNGETVGQHGVDGAIEAGKKIRIQHIGPERRLFQRRGVHAQPNVIEAQPRHERNVGCIRKAIGTRGRVVVNLCEPQRDVDSVLKVPRAGEGGVEGGGAILRQSR